MNRLILQERAVGPWPMNTYALICPTTKRSVLIDPGAEPDTLSSMLGDSEPLAIVLTHTHPDHIGALGEMRKRLDVPLWAYDGPHHNNMELDVDRGLQDGEGFHVGAHEVRVARAPGHVVDHICLQLQDDNRVIVGDTIFEGGPGKTWTPEQFQTTLRTLRDLVLSWPDDTICYPGHGPSFRLGDIRARIEAFLAKDHGAFYGDATWDM
jgi:glyoxylase-like metal-dependent hydrolase (beta-lactamase superfamily II)